MLIQMVLLPFGLCFFLTVLGFAVLRLIYQQGVIFWILKRDLLLLSEIDQQSVCSCVKTLSKFCDNTPFPWEHGWYHFLGAFQYAIRALARIEHLSQFHRTCILLAALLHDVDDPKVNGTGERVTQILTEAKCEQYLESVTYLISLVSTSTNGNHIPEGVAPESLIPRDVDRLLALGWLGHLRLWKPTLNLGVPWFQEDTPMPVSEAELQEVLIAKPLLHYVQAKGKTRSILDYYYDKLFHLDVVGSQQGCLKEENRVRIQRMKRDIFCLNRVLRFKRQLKK